MTYSRPHLGLLAVLAIYLAVTLTYGLLNPLGEAPDEIAHLALIRFISQEGPPRRHRPAITKSPLDYTSLLPACACRRLMRRGEIAGPMMPSH